MVTWIKINIDGNYEEKYYSWNKTLKDVTSNEAEAIELFFQLCDLFFDEYENKEFFHRLRQGRGDRYCNDNPRSQRRNACGTAQNLR